jgi:GrpB-like predicted nucleotidyltransferase (UPF0157 family)
LSSIRIRPASEVRAAAERAFDEHRREILAALPGAEVEHVGATAVPGSVTKGDVDVLVRVGAGEFDAACAALKRMYSVHQPHNWTPTLASFVDREATDIAVGVQLVAGGSNDDVMFAAFRDALTRDPQLLAEYNALKRRHDGEQYERYTEIKGRFIEKVLARIT